ncbi:MAG: 3-octaprenyl-4-hydroxybenzoate carboxy-lyase partner protein [Syntrophorhabdaceae bacterium PtaU1.Bin034]|nr:MAG: 3-octaprenyl-4-hydroxybenzoate carboxy-lyase partner protein [Syntrophorhabdaceae bacterium PtaU1.Bin034]
MKKVIVGITGATGVIYGIRLLEAMRDLEIESHVIISQAAKRNITIETDFGVKNVENLASQLYDPMDLAASISSGSFKTDGMVIVPCTIKTLSGIANSYNENLVTRAADVVLKERRRLILSVRETPLHKGHLELMSKVADLGAIILPPVPAFYHFPRTIEDLVDHIVGKIMDLLDIEHRLFQRWGGVEEVKQNCRVGDLRIR